MSRRKTTQEQESRTDLGAPAPVRPQHVPSGGLWFAPETVAAMEAMRAQSQADAMQPGMTLEEFCKRHFPDVWAKWLKYTSNDPAQRDAA